MVTQEEIKYIVHEDALMKRFTKCPLTQLRLLRNNLYNKGYLYIFYIETLSTALWWIQLCMTFLVRLKFSNDFLGWKSPACIVRQHAHPQSALITHATYFICCCCCTYMHHLSEKVKLSVHHRMDSFGRVNITTQMYEGYRLEVHKNRYWLSSFAMDELVQDMLCYVCFYVKVFFNKLPLHTVSEVNIHGCETLH